MGETKGKENSSKSITSGTKTVLSKFGAPEARDWKVMLELRVASRLLIRLSREKGPTITETSTVKERREEMLH